jgi:hypothetical protein
MVASKRLWLLAFLNFLFFGSVLVALAVAQFVFPFALASEWSPWLLDVFSWSGVAMVFGIFLSNLILSSLLFVTLPGFGFFAWSAGALAFRGVLWGLLSYSVSTHRLLLMFPVIFLEGEAYVFAAAAGTVAGVSWILPRWLYGEKALTRVESLKAGLRECLRLYVFVVALLLVAAIVESATVFCV